MVKLIVGMGLPGAGKSTLLESFANKYGYEFISVDAIREKNGLTPDQPSTEREWDEIRSLALENYKAGKTVVIDGTFLGNIRRRFLDFARENGVKKIQGLLMDTPEDLAWLRNQARSVKTTRELFDNRLAHLKEFPPDVAEGFDALFTTDEYGDLMKADLPKEHSREFNPRGTRS